MNEQNKKTNEPGSIVAIGSGKGGVGKTWMAISVSQALAHMGRKVLLFDGDLGLANVDVQLGLMPRKDLFTVLEKGMPLTAVKFAYEPGGFDIIAGRSGSASLASLSPMRHTALIDEIRGLATDYDDIIIDLGAGVERTVRHFASLADKLLVVTNDEPTSLTDAYAFIKLMARAGACNTICLAINSATTDKDGKRTFNTLCKACEGFLNFSPPLAGIVRNDKRVTDAIRNQTPLLTRWPTSTAASDIERIAEHLVTR